MNQNVTRCRVVLDEELIYEGINRAPVLMPGYIRASFDPAASASASIQSLLPYLHPTILYATCPRHTTERGPCASRRHIHTHHYHCTHDMHIMIGAVWRVRREARARARSPRLRIRVASDTGPEFDGEASHPAPEPGSAHPTHAKARPRHPIRRPGLGHAESGAPPDGLNRV